MSSLLTGCTTSSESNLTAPEIPRLRLMALGGPMNDPARAARGIDYLGAMGFALENQHCAVRRHSRFAGSDLERLSDLNGLTDLSVAMPDMIMATRGGYGAGRLLDRLDYAHLCPRLIQSQTVLMGYSDNTAVQLALLAQGGVVTFSGPMMYGDFGSPSPSAFMLCQLRQTLSQPSFTLNIDAPSPAGLECQGQLWGGNLTVLCSLIGSPYLPRIPGGILFLEDVGEDVYRIERMLLQLLLSGVLDQQSAVLLGQFSDYKPDSYDPDGYTLEHMLETLRTRTPVPILTNLPIGHVPDIAPLPVGAQARLSTDATGYRLTVSGYPTLQCLPAAFTSPIDGELIAQKG